MSCSAGWGYAGDGRALSGGRPRSGRRAAGIPGIAESASALIEGALAIAQASGEELLFVLGEPDYYRRFGFSAEAAAPFASPYAGPYFMALALAAGPEAARSPDQAAYARAFRDIGRQ